MWIAARSLLRLAGRRVVVAGMVRRSEYGGDFSGDSHCNSHPNLLRFLGQLRPIRLVGEALLSELLFACLICGAAKLFKAFHTAATSKLIAKYSPEVSLRL